MHVIARGSSDQWKTFASSPLMAAAMLIDGAVDEIYDEKLADPPPRHPSAARACTCKFVCLFSPSYL